MEAMKTKSRQSKQDRQSRQAKLMIALAVTAASYFAVWTLIGLML